MLHPLLPLGTNLIEANSKLHLRSVSEGVMLAVRVTPKSNRDEIAGIERIGGEAVLKARVRALPEAGRANQALARMVAQWLKLPRSSVSIVQGGKSRLKQVLIEGDAEALIPLIEARLAMLPG